MSSPGIYNRPHTAEVSRALQARLQRRTADWSDAQLRAYLADAVYLERKRFHAQRKTDPAEEEEVAAVEACAKATRDGRAAMDRAAKGLVDFYTHEIHNQFSRRTYKVATKVLPSALSRLLTASHSPRELLHRGEFDPDLRIKVETAQGDRGEHLRELAKTHTLVFAPTHVSNLDSPLIGYALHELGLPPAIYGAGLNLFGNPLMAFFMSRLGAYTVDRRKRHRVYKDVLKDYSVDSLSRGCHSLFFPGGTRSRSGKVEPRVKKGLLGTGIIAWQEALEQGRRDGEILVVPLTLSFSLVLEAETLIDDALEEEGRQRAIITDDEFSRPRDVASFTQQILSLDDAVVLRFGEPLDLLGNPVDENGHSLDRHGELLRRADYVCDKDGDVVWDEQRDRVYTGILAERLVDAWHRDNVLLPTQIAGFAAGRLLRRAWPDLSTPQLVLVPPSERRFERAELATAITELLEEIDALESAGRVRTRLPAAGQDRQTRSDAVLEEALSRFAGFHSRRALAAEGRRICIDPRLALYYGHRLDGYGLADAM